MRTSSEKVAEPDLSYFEVQAYIGATKHMGGLRSTRELIELCHMGKGAYVLDVGCGVGATPCYLAKRHRCRVVGVDISGRMIARASGRAKRGGVEDRVEFRVADAQNLPFEDALFDAVICESVVTFIEDKQGALSECVRVTKPGGYVGFNEELWIESPPPAEVVEVAERAWGITDEILTSDDWTRLLEGSGLRDVVVRPHKFNTWRESTQVTRYAFGDLVGMLCRVLSLYVKIPAFRKYMKKTRWLPRGLFDYLGYGLFVGRK